MVALAGFDANTVEPNKGFGLIDKGDYDAIITDSEKKDTQKGDGAYIAMTFQICQAGDYQNRKLWLNLNLWNPNEKAVTIAKGQLSAICRAVGVMTPNDTSDLHNKPMKISVGQRKNKTSNQLENVINGFKPRQSGPTQQPAKPASAAPVAAGSPW